MQVVPFIKSFEGRHSGLGRNIPVSHENNQASKEVEVHISIILGYPVLC